MRLERLRWGRLALAVSMAMAAQAALADSAELPALSLRAAPLLLAQADVPQEEDEVADLGRLAGRRRRGPA